MRTAHSCVNNACASAGLRLFLSNNTEGRGNPLSKVYSETVRLFARHRRVTTAVRYLNLRVYPGGCRFARTPLAAALERSSAAGIASWWESRRSW